MVNKFKNDTYKKDNYIFLVLFFLGWCYEWNGRELFNWPPLIVYYLRLVVQIPFFIYFFSNNQNNVKNIDYLFKKLNIAYIFLIFIILLERIHNNFNGLFENWKEYYLFLLLPFWGIIGSEIGKSENRAISLIRNISIYGSIASFVSFSMELAGVLKNSPFGPMYWPYRFIAIIGFFYFLLSLILKVNKEKYTILFLISSSLSVFWGLYKYTIFSTLIGMTLLIIYFILKKVKLNKKTVIKILFFIFILIISLFLINTFYGGAILAYAQDIITYKWLHNIQEYEGSDPYTQADIILGGRYLMWENIIYSIQNNLLLGLGLGQRYSIGIVTHSGFIDIILSFGILGFILFISIVFIWFHAIIRFNPKGKSLLIMLTGFGFICTIITANLFGSLWIQFPTINAYCIIFAGIMLRIAANNTNYYERK